MKTVNLDALAEDTDDRTEKSNNDAGNRSVGAKFGNAGIGKPFFSFCQSSLVEK